MILVTTKERLQQYLDYKGISKTRFYNDLDIKRGLLDSDKMKATISDVVLAKILVAYPDLNFEWLLTGNGEMQKQNKLPSTESLINTRLNSEDLISIPIVDISIAAGCGGCDNSDNIEIIDTIKLPSHMLHHGSVYYCARVHGESMSPTMLDSSYVILRLLDRSEWGNIKDYYVYGISDREGRSYIKRLKNRFREHGFITCMSDNVDKANYPNFNLMENEINHILYAEWYLSAKMPNLNETYYDKVNQLEDDMDVLKNQVSLIMKNISQIK